MRGFLTLARLEPAERSLVVHTVLLVAVVRAALWIISFERLRSWVGAYDRIPFSLPVPRDIRVERLVWAVRAASRRIPGASCLTQSVALRCLLARAGYDSRILIGVAKDSESGFHAHAWVDHDGRPLLSPLSEVDRYARLLSL